MKLLINIPKEFEQHFQMDRFEDSLHRLSADAHLLAGNYEQEIVTMLIDAFATAIPVSPHGRLGDIDKLAKRIEYERYHHGHTDGLAAQHHVAEYLHFLKVISDTPTIIPAEEGE